MLSLKTYILSFQIIIHTLQKKENVFQFINEKDKRERESKKFDSNNSFSSTETIHF
jgi:hypothetical protein